MAVNLNKELTNYDGIQEIRGVASQNHALKALLDNYEINLMHLEAVASGSMKYLTKQRDT